MAFQMAKTKWQTVTQQNLHEIGELSLPDRLSLQEVLRYAAELRMELRFSEEVSGLKLRHANGVQSGLFALESATFPVMAELLKFIAKVAAKSSARDDQSEPLTVGEKRIIKDLANMLLMLVDAQPPVSGVNPKNNPLDCLVKYEGVEMSLRNAVECLNARAQTMSCDFAFQPESNMLRYRRPRSTSTPFRMANAYNPSRKRQNGIRWYFELDEIPEAIATIKHDEKLYAEFLKNDDKTLQA